MFTTTAEYPTMYHDLPRSARFWSFLLAVDQDLASKGSNFVFGFCLPTGTAPSYVREGHGRKDMHSKQY
jgi:hypothetical protein